MSVIPILVEDATMPAEQDLPDDLKPPARRMSYATRSWDYDLERLAATIEAALAGDAGPRQRITRRWQVLIAHWQLLDDSSIRPQSRDEAVDYDNHQVWQRGHSVINGNPVTLRLDSLR